MTDNANIIITPSGPSCAIRTHKVESAKARQHEDLHVQATAIKVWRDQSLLDFQMQLRSLRLMTLEYLFDSQDEFCWLMPQHLMAFPSDESSLPEPDTLKVQLCKPNMQLVPPVTRKTAASTKPSSCHSHGNVNGLYDGEFQLGCSHLQAVHEVGPSSIHSRNADACPRQKMQYEA